ncbi:right-handed parallel beta-helix repeat-containing protein [Pseudonocardia acaciae]|uniref:right-handed parallel beta-helix repeat-containing protein n=1 Tax=Pseudonocardia acaciae TaxID=551276 RepID=UPI00048E5F21|nr:right-handed parallel beta-helix repeat-containing protein [Pseudonocardia acaciae]
MTTLVVGPLDNLAGAIAAAAPGDKVFFTGEHPAQRITNSGTDTAFCELYSNGTGRIHSEGGAAAGNTEYGLWLDRCSYWGFRDFTVHDAAKGIVADTTTHTAFKLVEVHTTKDEGWKFRSNSHHLYLSNCAVHDTGIAATDGVFGEGYYVGDASSNWPDPASPDATQYIKFTNCKAWRTYGDGWDIKEGSRYVHLVGCEVDHRLGNAPAYGNQFGDTGCYTRGDYVYFEGCTIYSAPGYGFKCYDTAAIGGVVYGRNVYLKAGSATSLNLSGVGSQSDAPDGMHVYSDFSGTKDQVGGGWLANYGNLNPSTYTAPTFTPSPASSYYTAEPWPSGTGTTNPWAAFFS